MNRHVISLIIRIFILIALAFGLSYFLFGCTPKANGFVYKNVRYGSYERNVMDVYLPERLDSSVKGYMILIHGGGWVAGDKNDYYMNSIRSKLNMDGVPCAIINYRFASGNIKDQMDDLSNVIATLKARSPGWEMPSNVFGLAGASAGGHLSLLFAYAYDPSNEVKCVSSLVGPTDFFDSLMRANIVTFISPVDTLMMKLLGVHYSDTSSVIRNASPLYVSKAVPTQLFYGKLDNLVPYTQGERLHDTLVAHAYIQQWNLYVDAGHNVIGDRGQHKEDINSKISSWARMYLH